MGHFPLRKFKISLGLRLLREGPPDWDYMLIFLRRYWVVLPIVASMGTQCDRAPRAGIPTEVVEVELVLNSVPEASSVDGEDYMACLNRMDGLQNHVRPSWRSSPEEPSGSPVLFTEMSPNVWQALFFDVPVDFLNTMTVHDTNECARNPAGMGHVINGVTVNGTEVTNVVGARAMAFELNEDGSVKPVS